jgi:hypothetical protein
MCLTLEMPGDSERDLRAIWGSALEKQMLEATLVEAYRQGGVSGEGFAISAPRCFGPGLRCAGAS